MCAVAVAGSPVFSPTRAPVSSMTATAAESQTPPSSPCGVKLQSRPVATRGMQGLQGSAVLKRKRPARLEIPVMSPVAAVEAGKEEVKEVEAEEEEYAVYCKKGRREVMEDRHSASLDWGTDRKTAFFGVFDGHGGDKAAEFAAEHIGQHVMREVEKCGSDEIEAAVRRGYHTTDEDFLGKCFNGGTCCVTALLWNENLFVSNAGDCRAVLSRNGVAEALTVDHRPSRADERERIQKLGGYVDNCRGVWRIQGSLAVSRSIGDSHLKQWVIAEPETRALRIEEDCEFLILASDGLWDKVTNQEAVDLARPLCTNNENSRMLIACKKLSELSLARGSVDDISVMVVKLGWFI